MTLRLGLGLAGRKSGAAGPPPAPLLAFNTVAISEGDSISAFVDGRSVHGWLSVRLNGRLKFSPNDATRGTEGTGGDKWADVAGDVAALLSEHSPGLVPLIIGTNDTNVTSPFSNAMASAEDAIDDLNAGGARVLYMLIPSRADANAALKAADQATNNSTLSGWAATKDLMIADPATTLWDPEDATQANADEIHPLTRGSYNLSCCWFDVLDPLLGTGDVYSVLPANILTNPTLTGAAGTVATGMEPGSVAPTGWTIDNDTGATVTASIVTDGGGVRWLRFDVSGSASTASLDLRVYQTVTRAIAVGDKYEGCAKVRIMGAGGVGDPAGINGWELSGFQAAIFSKSNLAASGQMIIRVDNLVRAMPLPSTGTGSSSQVGLFFRFAIGAVEARIEFALPHWGQIV